MWRGVRVVLAWYSEGSGRVFFRVGECERILDGLWYDGNVSPFLGCFQAEGWHRTPRRGNARWARGGTEGLS